MRTLPLKLSDTHVDPLRIHWTPKEGLIHAFGKKKRMSSKESPFFK